MNEINNGVDQTEQMHRLVYPFVILVLQNYPTKAAHNKSSNQSGPINCVIRHQAFR